MRDISVIYLSSLFLYIMQYTHYERERETERVFALNEGCSRKPTTFATYLQLCFTCSQKIKTVLKTRLMLNIPTHQWCVAVKWSYCMIYLNHFPTKHNITSQLSRLTAHNSRTASQSQSVKLLTSFWLTSYSKPFNNSFYL